MGTGISIIIPCYNDGRYIREAVNSVFAQNFKLPFEIIIADDGSTDPATLEQLRVLRSDCPEKIQIIFRKKDGGTAAARNTALEHAHYNYIFALDVDDRLSVSPKVVAQGSYLDRAIAVLEANSDVAFVHCRHEIFEATSQPYCFSRKYNEKELLKCQSPGPFIVYRRADAVAVGGYNSKVRYAEDWEFAIALINKFYRAGKQRFVHHFHEPFVMYRKRADGTSKTDTNQVPKQEELLEAITRNPEIYAHYYPGLKSEDIIVQIMEENKFVGRWRMIAFVSELSRHPVRSYRDGAFSYAFSKIEHRLSRVWGNVTASKTAPQQAVVEGRPNPQI